MGSGSLERSGRGEHRGSMVCFRVRHGQQDAGAVFGPDPGVGETGALGEVFPFRAFPAASDREDAVGTEFPWGSSQPEERGQEGEEDGIALHVAEQDETS